MNKRQLKKYRGWEGALPCIHLYKDSQLLTTDPIPYYQYEEYCKIKDWEVMEDNGVEEYQFGYCTKCRHYCPRKEDIRKLHKDIKIWKHLPATKPEEEEEIDFSFNF